MEKMLCFLAVALMAITINGSVRAAGEMSVRDILLRNEQARKATNETGVVDMILTDKDGKVRTRKITWLADDTDPVNRQSLIRFLAPKDVEGTGFLEIEHAGSENARWLYLPALRKTRRISGSDKSDSFMGTDFAYEDISIEDGVNEVDDHRYRILRSEKMNGADCWVIEAIPTSAKEISDSGYGRREIWITKDHFVRTFAKYWDKNGELMKQLSSTDIKPLPGGPNQWRAYKSYMENFQTGHTTRLIFTDYYCNSEIEPSKIFNARHLESGR